MTEPEIVISRREFAILLADNVMLRKEGAQP